MQFAELCHELLCGLPTAVRTDEEAEEASSSAFATVLRGAFPTGAAYGGVMT